MKSLYPFLWTACITPFDSSGDNIDYDSLYRLLIAQDRVGNGILLLGSTGEGLSLTKHERHKLIAFVCQLELRTKIMVNVPGVNLHQSLNWISFCNDMPIHNYLITTPIYTKPGVIGQTLWFEKLLEKARFPAMLYNIPSRAGVDLYVKTVHNLSHHEKFWAIKDSSGTVNTLIEYNKVAPNIKLFCGDDNMVLKMSSYNIDGLISVASNIWPRIVMHKSFDQERVCLLNQIILRSKKKINVQILEDENTKSLINAWKQVCKALSIATNPIPTKALLNDIGIIKYRTVRLPLSTRDLPSIEKLKQINTLIEKLRL